MSQANPYVARDGNTHQFLPGVRAKVKTGRYFFRIVQTGTGHVVAASPIPYASADLAHAAGNRERKERGLMLGDGFHTEVDAEVE